MVPVMEPRWSTARSAPPWLQRSGCPRGFDEWHDRAYGGVSSVVYTPRQSIRHDRFWLKHRPELFSE